ncbi:MFS transporter [Mucilaginibacter sp. Bleaf8]|uniref:MFS transporter n=1 Tax=Mucilaginibacter sp. Bleaf8 TaxID=2834430 RepID=UPI001BD1A6EE|nr:MFS transporter [Mucilaginibacter sp. Bleaf8]MBS7563110.1 MFS transporter [Mucilaginibacter sp. Bleaf8]
MNDIAAKSNKSVIFLVIVASLGYFVDIYDLLIFSIVRVKSLHDIGVTDSEIRTKGEFIINMQMLGLLLGGLLWGIIGDKYGRIRVLFGSILLYSIANFANGLVTNYHTYAIVRFIAGIGLAGELGAGITLVSETMSKKNRGYGTMIVAVVGLFGAVLANLVSKYGWQNAYFIGGGLGVLLLLLRMGTFESGMFKQAAESEVSRGNFMILFTSKARLVKYLCCILIGMPLWFVVGILVSQAPEIGKELHAAQPLSAGTGIMFTYIGISIGDIFAGLFAQLTKSRRLTMLVFQLLSVVSVILYLNAHGITDTQFTWLCLFIGFSVGYWATFVTIASEQFGTNIRSTVTTTVPNFVRGALIPITVLFEMFVKYFAEHGYKETSLIYSAYIMMAIVTVVALLALGFLKETFSKDLNYLEEEAEASNATIAS